VEGLPYYEGKDGRLEKKQNKGMSIGYFVRKESKSATEDLIFMVWLLCLGKCLSIA
jgi:hypothetical protein